MRVAHHRPRPHRLATTDRARRPGGYVLVEFAFLLVPLLIMVGLSVDVGYWYNRASNLQKAADAAALAGVVWLPDTTKAETYAKQAAARNGFVDGTGGISVDVEPVGERRLRVTIKDPAVGSFFYQVLGGRKISLERQGTAEYVLPVPLGSPKNYFGTGSLLDDPELLYQSVNPACTSKVNGDRHQSLHFDPLNQQTASLTSCSATPTNADYRSRGYQLYVEAPAGRSSNIDVLLYDPRYNQSAITWQVPRQECTIDYPSNWSGPSTSSSSNLTIYGPAQYQNKTSSNGSWSSTKTLNEGQSFTYRRDRLRYKLGTESCRTVYDTMSEPGIDSFRGSGNESFTFTLIDDKNTPLDDSDNTVVPGCSKTYSASTAFDLSYLGSRRWNKLCTITPQMSSGKYILQVTNGAPGTLSADGSNQWGLVAKYANAPGDGLCDGRTDVTCPRVYGRDAISVYANTSAGVASFFLAEIPDYHTGKTLELELWDPGEGGSKIEILQPTGANTWGVKKFSWASFNEDGSADSSGSNTSSVDVTGSKFNGRLLRIRIQLDDYAPPANNLWWKIRYTFTSGSVTDRTTWSAKVIGDPVHLVEDDF